jgi:hypothetical protein
MFGLALQTLLQVQHLQKFTEQQQAFMEPGQLYLFPEQVDQADVIIRQLHSLTTQTV